MNPFPDLNEAVCEALGDPTMSIRLLAGIEVDSAAPSRAMWELGRIAKGAVYCMGGVDPPRGGGALR